MGSPFRSLSLGQRYPLLPVSSLGNAGMAQTGLRLAAILPNLACQLPPTCCLLQVNDTLAVLQQRFAALRLEGGGLQVYPLIASATLCQRQSCLEQ